MPHNKSLQTDRGRITAFRGSMVTRRPRLMSFVVRPPEARRMGTLELQVGDGVGVAHVLPPDPGPNNGGYLGRVSPGGPFHGIGFDELRALGTGRHQFSLDERAGSVRGGEPEYESEGDRKSTRL